MALLRAMSGLAYLCRTAKMKRLHLLETYEAQQNP
jgi:hypothetical protein